MDTLLNGPVSSPGHENGEHFKESYHSATIPGCRLSDQPEKCKTEESLASDEALEGKVASSSSDPYKDFSGHFHG